MVADLFKLDPQRDPLIGRTLDGRYEVLGRLGSGGMGVVYRGRQAHLQRFVAIKVLHRDTAAIPEWRQRFEREARALSALAHPNVVPVTDSGFDGGVPFLVMELLEGKTLSELIKEGSLPLGRALDIGRQILRGLAFAHGKGIIHRDLKPTNVFLQALPDQADHVRLLDFGTAKFLEGSGSPTLAETLTRVGVVFGTPAYMSPEQAKAAPVDARTDVYAAGVLLFELLAGRRPFVAEAQDGYIAAHLTQPVPSLAKVRSGIPGAAAFQTVLERAMAKDPAARFKDAGAMLAALEEVVAKVPAAAMIGEGGAAPGGSLTRPARGRRASQAGGHWWRRAAVLVVIAAVGGGAGVIYVSRGVKTRGEIAAPPTSPIARSETTARTPPSVEPAAAGAPPPVPSPSQLPAPAPPPANAPPAAAPLETAPPAAAPVAAPAGPSPTGSTEEPSAQESPPREPHPATATAEPPPAAPVEAPTVASGTPPPAKTPSPSEAPPAPEPGAAPARRERPPTGIARDPWREPLPRALRSIHDRLERGAHMSQRSLRPAYAFAHQNPSDPRPWLLLGHAYAQLDWLTDSVERYVHAHQIDSASRADPQMLADLLKAAAHPAAGSAGARAVRDIYGAEALPALKKAIDAATRSGDRDDTARLVRLRDLLVSRR